MDGSLVAASVVSQHWLQPQSGELGNWWHTLGQLLSAQDHLQLFRPLTLVLRDIQAALTGVFSV